MSTEQLPDPEVAERPTRRQFYWWVLWCGKSLKQAAQTSLR